MATTTKKSDNPITKVASSGTIKSVEQKTKPFQEFLTKFNNDGAMTFAGVLAYNLLMATLPIFIAIIGILGLVLGSRNSENIANQLVNALPSISTQQNGAVNFHTIITLAVTQLQKDAGILVIIAILLAVFGGSRLFIVVEQFLDLIYRVRPRPLIPQNLVAIGMLLLFVILIPLMVLVASGPQIILGLFRFVPFLGDSPLVKFLIGPGGFLTSIVTGLIVGFILFEAIYIVVPNQNISVRNSWRGAVAAAIALELFLLAFPFYATHFLGSYAGSIGFAVILLLFFYYFAVILLLGAEVNAYFSEHVRPIPNDIITFISTAAGRLNKDIPDTESRTHQDSKPTDNALNAHVADIRSHEQRIRRKNSQKQQQLAAKAIDQEKAKAAENQQKKASKLPFTLVEVALGTALTLGLELLRLRRRGK